MYINPDVNLLKSLRGERTNYADLIGEGVDNALDAGASTVRVDLDADSVRFEDDGQGIGALREGGRIIHIDLSKDNPFIKELLAHRDERLISDCIRSLALMIYEAERNKFENQGQLSGLDFGRRVALHIKAQSGGRAA